MTCSVMGARPTVDIYDVPIGETPSGFRPPQSTYGTFGDFVAGGPEGLVIYGGLQPRPIPNAPASSGRAGGYSFSQHGVSAPTMPDGIGDGGLQAPGRQQFVVGPGTLTLWTEDTGSLGATADLYKVDIVDQADPTQDVETLIESKAITFPTTTFNIPDDGSCLHYVHVQHASGSGLNGGWDWLLESAPAAGIGWDILEPDGTFLTTLTNIWDQAIRVELNGPGTGHFVINRNDPQATAVNLARGNIVRVTIPEIDPDQAIYEWVLELGDFDLVDSDEEGGEDLQFGGRGTLTYLEHARIWHESNIVGSGWVHADRGVWRFEDESYGYIVRQILQEAENRSPSPLPDIDVRFGAILDSDLVAWPIFDGRYELPIGESAYSEIMALVEQGRMRVRMDPGFIFRAYNQLGADKTGAFGVDTVRFERGVNIVDELKRSRNGRTFATHALVRGAESYIAVESPTYAPGDPVVETYVDQSGTTDEGMLESAGEAALELRDDAQNALLLAHLPGNDPANGLYYPGPSYSLNGKYWPGDIVTVHTAPGELDYDEQAFRIYAVTITYDEAGQLAPPIVEINAPYPGESPIDNSVIVNRTGGGTGSGASSLHSHPQYQLEADFIHGLLDELTDDDHPQYVPTTTGATRYLAHGNTGTTETVDWSVANVHNLDLDANCTLTVTGAVSTRGGSPATTEGVIEVVGNGFTMTWPASFDWGTAGAPTLAAGLNVIAVYTTDGGTNYRAFLVGGGADAPTTADYLVGTAQAGLSAEIVVGTTPGGELGGTWASPTVDPTHSGSAHLALGSTGSTAAAGDHDHPGGSGTHSESLTDGASNFIFAAGDIVTVVGVPD